MDNGDLRSTTIRLDDFIGHRFRKRIIQCRGLACGDPEARCHRSLLSSSQGQKPKFHFILGGCTAVNEKRYAKEGGAGGITDTYKKIWQITDADLPRSTDPKRLVIPRSFSLSEFSFFFSRLFVPEGIPVHVDNVTAEDIRSAQSHIHIDTCAPHMGAVGQMMRRTVTQQTD